MVDGAAKSGGYNSDSAEGAQGMGSLSKSMGQPGGRDRSGRAERKAAEGA